MPPNDRFAASNCRKLLADEVVELATKVNASGTSIDVVFLAVLPPAACSPHASSRRSASRNQIPRALNVAVQTGEYPPHPTRPPRPPQGLRQDLEIG